MAVTSRIQQRDEFSATQEADGARISLITLSKVSFSNFSPSELASTFSRNYPAWSLVLNPRVTPEVYDEGLDEAFGGCIGPRVDADPSRKSSR